MENVSTVFVHIYPSDILTIHIATKMRALFDHQAPFAHLMGKVGEGSPEKSRTDDQIVILRIEGNQNVSDSPSP